MVKVYIFVYKLNIMNILTAIEKLSFLWDGSEKNAVKTLKKINQLIEMSRVNLYIEIEINKDIEQKLLNNKCYEKTTNSGDNTIFN